jgi:hypothetical protein
VETRFAGLHPPPRSLRKPHVFWKTLIRALSAGICGLSFLGFWSLQVSRQQNGDFWHPVSKP